MLRCSLFIAMFTGATCLAAPSFTRDVHPILKKHCQGCHQPASLGSGLDLTSYASFQKGGKRGPGFIATKPGESLAVKCVDGSVQPRMPLGQAPLPAEMVAVLRDWIAAGALDDSQDETVISGPARYQQAPVITALRFSPDGTSIAVSGNREVLLHQADGSALLKRLPGKAERILSVAFSSDGKTLVAGGGTPAKFGEVQIWDVPTAKQRGSITLTTDTVFGASISPDASYVAVGAADNTVRVIETATAKELYKIGNHENWVLATVFGVDSKRFVSVGRDRAAKLMDAKSGAFLENINLLRGELTAIARHPKQDMVVIGGEDRYAYVYRMDRPRVMKIADDSTHVRTLERQDGVITALDWSPDGKRIAVAGASAAVNLYDAETGDRVAACNGHSAGIYAVAFSPDGKRIATGGFDGKVRLYDVADCSLQRAFVPVPLDAASSAAGTSAGGAQ